MSMAATSALESLKLAIHGVSAPFFCAGTYTPDNPVALVFKDKTRFEVIRAENSYEQPKTLQPLFDHCKPAPFGDGKRTRYDRGVRDALQLKAEKRGFTVESFDLESAGILQQVQRELLPHDPDLISAELYTVNVYQSGGHFAPHKDTPRGSEMFGTLVVCLPSQFYQGDLVLRHRGVVERIDWAHTIAKQENPNELHWVAFFGDVDHQIEEVWGGARVTLTYLLRRSAGDSPMQPLANEDVAPAVHDAWQKLLADTTFLPKGGILAYPCCHLYHQDARFQSAEARPITQKTMTSLKGRDQLVAATALQAGLNVEFQPYMFENCVDETWQLERFPTPKETARLRQRIDHSHLEKNLPLAGGSAEKRDFGVTWLEDPPSSDETSWQSNEITDPDLPAAAHLHQADYCPWGYFGNESSYVDFYTYAALHFQIPPLGEGTRPAKKAAKRPTVKKPRATRKSSKK